MGTSSNAVYSDALTQIERAVPNTPIIGLLTCARRGAGTRLDAAGGHAILVARQLLGGGKPISNFDAIGEIVRTADPSLRRTDLQIGPARSANRHQQRGKRRNSPPGAADCPGWFAARAAGRKCTRAHLRLAPAPAVGASTRLASLRQHRAVSRAQRLGAIRTYIITATIIVALQSALIAGLVLQRARRRRSELELRENEAALRQRMGRIRISPGA